MKLRQLFEELLAIDRASKITKNIETIAKKKPGGTDIHEHLKKIKEIIDSLSLKELEALKSGKYLSHTAANLRNVLNYTVEYLENNEDINKNLELFYENLDKNIKIDSYYGDALDAVIQTFKYLQMFKEQRNKLRNKELSRFGED